MTQLGPGQRYKSKAITYKDNDVMEITLLLTIFDGEGNDALSSAGWRGEYLMVSKVDGAVTKSTTDYRMFARDVCRQDDPWLRRLLIEIDTGTLPIDAISDGETYTPPKIKELMQTYGVDIE